MLSAILISAMMIGNPGTLYWDSELRYVGGIAYHMFSAETASTVLGPAAASFGTCGSFYGQVFSAPAVQSYNSGPLIPCWNGVNDIRLFIYFACEAADVIAAGETIIFDFEYRSVGSTGGSGLGGPTVTVQATYTQDGAGTDCEAPLIAFVDIDIGDGDQPYTYFDTVMGILSRSGGTYSGDPVIGNVVFGIPYKQTCRAG